MIHDKSSSFWVDKYMSFSYLLKGPCHPKLSFSMLNSHGHWSLWHRSFVPESPLKKENAFFQKFLEIVCIWKMHTGKEFYSKKWVPEKKSVSQKCVPEKNFTLKYCTGKENYSQILYRKRIWFPKIVTHKIF